MRLTKASVTATFAVILITRSADAQETTAPEQKPKQPAKELAGAATSLDEMLTKALKDNPDIRVAEAKVREAEAELNRTRLQVTQKVIAFHRKWESQRLIVDLCQKEANKVSERVAAGSLPKEMQEEKQQLVANAKARLAEVEAELPYLIGKQHLAQPRIELAVTPFINQPEFPVPIQFDANTMARPALNLQWPHVSSPPVPVAAGTAEKLRKALDSKISVNFEGQPLADVLSFFQEQIGGIAFRPMDLPEVREMQIKLELNDQPLGACIQAIEDSYPDLQFVVRDYGVFVTMADRVPSGAVRVQSFWKEESPRPKSDVNKGK
jgi:hypothetical protein